MTWSSHPKRLQINNLLCSSDAKAIEEFLDKLDPGLDIYKEVFNKNDITLEILKEMNRTDLKDIGITSFGHQHEILEGIKQIG